MFRQFQFEAKSDNVGEKEDAIREELVGLNVFVRLRAGMDFFSENVYQKNADE